jgi:hypothetical protein
MAFSIATPYIMTLIVTLSITVRVKYSKTLSHYAEFPFTRKMTLTIPGTRWYNSF